MRVDQKRQARVVTIVRAAAEMNFPDRGEWETRQIAPGVEAEIGRADENVVDVEQKAATGPPDDLGQKLRLADRRLGESDISRGVFEEDRPAECALYDVDVFADPRERFVRVRQGQQIVEKCAIVRRPGEVLGDESRLIAFRDARQSGEMGAVERPGRADRQADAVQRKRIAAADRLEPTVRRTARAHVVLGVNLEKAEFGTRIQDGVEMLGLEAHADGLRRNCAWTGFRHEILRFERCSTPVSSRPGMVVLQRSPRPFARSRPAKKVARTCNAG